jgi:hypothetical protein
MPSAHVVVHIATNERTEEAEGEKSEDYHHCLWRAPIVVVRQIAVHGPFQEPQEILGRLPVKRWFGLASGAIKWRTACFIDNATRMTRSSK